MNEEFVNTNRLNVLRGIELNHNTSRSFTHEFGVEMDRQRWHEIEACKERFLRDGENPLSSPYMYPEIADSWIRSKRYGIDPYTKTLGRNLKPKELTALIRDKQALVDIAGEFMKNHLSLLSASGYYMCLTDENGILLLTAGHKSRVESFERINARPGAVWSEDMIGTCCHSLVISLKRPVQLIGPYYYCEIVYDNIGSGTPIIDENGDLMGVLLVVDATVPEKQVRQTHLLGWVVSAGLAIESQLKLRKHSYYLGLANKIVDTTIEAIGEGCITMNRGGYITHINREGAELLGIKDNEGNGKHFSELFGSQIPVEKVLTEGKAINNYDIKMNNAPVQSHRMDIEPIFIEDNNIPNGIFIRMSLSGKINKVVTKCKDNPKDSFASIQGSSKALENTIEKARRVAHKDGGVLLIGESGTGKELFAHAIHDEDRPEGSFIAINCASFPKNLIESELFGYEGGSFTGAERRGRMGKIELANGGTLFLDEIGDMPLEVQPVLLRVLEDKKVMRIGGKKYIPVDFQVIAATNKDLLELVEKKQFRQDLYYRLAVFKLIIPPLKERNDDVLHLAHFFIERIGQRTGMKTIPHLSPEVCKIFLEYDWPGNVRQLENTIAYAMAMVTEDEIKVIHLPDEILYHPSTCYYAEKRLESNDSTRMLNANGTKILGANMTISEIEKQAIENTLLHTGNNVPNAAKILGLARSTLYRKMKEYDINT